MNSYCTNTFWKLFHDLPSHVQDQAKIAYEQFKRDPYHRSLHFKCIDKQERIYSARVGRRYRVVGRMESKGIVWEWIGTHEEYNHF